MNDNWDLLGHQWAVQLLKNHLAEDRLRHAYLFTGPSGVGRRTLALRFAQVLNDPDRQYQPESRTSQQIAQMQHPDLSIVRRQEGDRDIKIDAIRELQHSVSLSPYMAAYRVALLLDFDEANDNAANALLKTLEEPPGRVVLLVTAESPESLLPTIVSRCEVLRLRPMPIDQLAQGLEQTYQMEPEQARLLAHIANGKPGYALHLAQNPEIIEQRQAWLDEHWQLLGGSRVTRFAYAEKLSKDRDEFFQSMLVWLSFWRDVLLKAAHSSAALTNPDRESEIEQLGASVSLEAARKVVMALEQKLGELRANANARLAAEALMLHFPYV